MWTSNIISRMTAGISRCRSSNRLCSARTYVTLDTTTGLSPSGLFVPDTEVMSYQGITANTLNNVGRCLSGSCDPLNPPSHSTMTPANSISVPNYIGMSYTQGNRNIALMKLTLYDELTSISAGST